MNQERGRSRGLPTGAIVGAVFGLGIGLLLGLVYAYSIAPANFVNAEPQHLREDYAAFYWRLVTQSYIEHRDQDLVNRQLGPWDDQEQLQTVLDRARIESSPQVRLTIDSLVSDLGSAAEPGTDEPSTPGEEPAAPDDEEPGGGSLLTRVKWGTFLGVLLLLLLILALIGLVLSRSRRRQAEPAGATRGATASDETDWLATMHPETEAEPSAPGLGHFVTSYALGNDHYDQSFSIETPTGEFLGECGVGISETIGEGTPDHVTAFEVWLFDKNDIRTVTKVVMSEYAYNDTELRDRLAPKGEAVLAQANVPLVLETATLRVTATATEALYTQDDAQLPPNSAFERLTVELVAQERQDAGAAETEDDALGFGD